MVFEDLLNQMLRSNPVPDHQWELAHDLMGRIDFINATRDMSFPYQYRACLRADILSAMVGHGLVIDHRPRTLWNMSLASYALTQWSERINHCQFSPKPQINAQHVTGELISVIKLIHKYAPEGFSQEQGPTSNNFIHKVLWNSLNDEYGAIVLRACLDLNMSVSAATIETIDRLPNKPLMGAMLKGHLMQQEVKEHLDRDAPKVAKKM